MLFLLDDIEILRRFPNHHDINIYSLLRGNNVLMSDT